jgi:hypothetical protein
MQVSDGEESNTEKVPAGLDEPSIPGTQENSKVKKEVSGAKR